MMEENKNELETPSTEEGHTQVPEDIQKDWFTLVVYPGRELKIRDRLRKLAQSEAYKEYIFRVVAPSYKEKNEKGKIREKMHYTQYVYFEGRLNDKGRLHNDAYHGVKIDGVRHILGDAVGPQPLRPNEIDRILEIVEAGELQE